MNSVPQQLPISNNPRKLILISAYRPATLAAVVPAAEGGLPHIGLPPHRLGPRQHVVHGQRARQVPRLPHQLGTHAGHAHLPAPARLHHQVWCMLGRFFCFMELQIKKK